MPPIKYSLLFIALAWVLGLTVALLSPDDILGSSAVLTAYVSTYLNFFSYSRALGSESSFPMVTQLYHSLMAWTMPFFAVLSYSWMKGRVGRERDGLLFKAKLSVGNKLALMLLIPVWACFIWFASMNDGGDVRLVPLGSSRVALGLFGISFHCLPGAMLSAIVFSIQRVFFEKGGRA